MRTRASAVVTRTGTPRKLRSFPVRPAKSSYHSATAAFQVTRSPRPSTAKTGSSSHSSTRCRTSRDRALVRHRGRRRGRCLVRAEGVQVPALAGVEPQGVRQALQDLRGRANLLPCSRRLYQAGLTLARNATSSRSRPPGSGDAGSPAAPTAVRLAAFPDGFSDSGRAQHGASFPHNKSPRSRTLCWGNLAGPSADRKVPGRSTGEARVPGGPECGRTDDPRTASVSRVVEVGAAGDLLPRP